MGKISDAKSKAYDQLLIDVMAGKYNGVGISDIVKELNEME